MKEKTPAKSVAYAGNQTFAQADRRNYFFIYATDDIELTFGGGGGIIPITAGGFFEPRVMPTGEFTVFTDGVFVFLSDCHERAA